MNQRTARSAVMRPPYHGAEVEEGMAHCPETTHDHVIPGRIRCICFDLGGVVVRICRSWDEACEAAGIRTTLNGELTDWKERQLIDASFLHQSGRLDLHSFAERCVRILDGRYTVDEILAIHHAWIQEEYDGICNVIRSLVDSPYELALLSNTSAAHWKRLLTYPAIQHISHRFASHELGLHKPDEAIYRAVEDNIGCAAGEILFFDDLEPNVEAARNRGWRAEHIDPMHCTASQIVRHLQRYDIAASL